MKKAVVDKNTCIGCGACTTLAPKSFKMSDDGKSIALDPAGDDEQTIQKAIDGCPVRAISWKTE